MDAEQKQSETLKQNQILKSLSTENLRSLSHGDLDLVVGGEICLKLRRNLC